MAPVWIDDDDAKSTRDSETSKSITGQCYGDFNYFDARLPGSSTETSREESS